MQQRWCFRQQLQQWGPQALSLRHRLSLAQARAYCRWLAHTHYENFSVVSCWLPRRLRPAIEAIYAYCRWADDLADEIHSGAHALQLLDWWYEQLVQCYYGECRHPVFVALQPVLSSFAIPIKPLADLLIAFRQDQHQHRYATFSELLDYCRFSANPVGHLVLYLFDSYDAQRAVLADAVCTGLQLANFWQDVRRDWQAGRLYLPLEDCRRFGYTEVDLAAQRYTPSFRDLLCFEVERTRCFFDQGEPLVTLLPPAARPVVSLFINGGRAILQQIERQHFNVWDHRPVVSLWIKWRLLAQVAGAGVLAWLTPR
ncbi:MAG: squalene synthase HpnC [Gemmataceae bacterium]|nr:squalene synthase HpnC [Gemmataceae bacterium]MDW8244092.1 squalene synthase HpnC [Thermogemmata sp.]